MTTDITQAEALAMLRAFAIRVAYYKIFADTGLKDVQELRREANALISALFASPPVSNGSSPDHCTANAAAETPPPEVTDDMVRRAADVLMGHVNAPESAIYRAARLALSAALTCQPVEPLSETASTERDKSRDEQQNLSPPDTVTVGRSALATVMRGRPPWYDQSPPMPQTEQRSMYDAAHAVVVAALNGGEQP